MQPLTQDVSTLQGVDHLLHRSSQDLRPIVVMMCGIAGAGKSTLSKQIIGKYSQFIRLSIDKTIFETHGLYNIDYPAQKLTEYQEEAYRHVKSELQRLLLEKKQDIVLDLSFYNKEYRDQFKEIIVENQGRWVLLSLEAEKDVLWRRITQRRQGRDALALNDENRNGDSAFDIDEATFNMYWDNFEKPRGEGEVVIAIQ